MATDKTVVLRIVHRNERGSRMDCRLGQRRYRLIMMGLHSFDRAKSNRVDSTVGDDRKSSKKRKRKRRNVRISSLNTA